MAFKKGQSWLADWRTPDGVRHRKAFTTRKAAKAHEQANARPTKPRRSKASANASTRQHTHGQEAQGNNQQQQH